MLATRIYFDLRTIQVKIFISLVIMFIFFLIYNIIPNNELGISKYDTNSFDLFRYTMLNHMGIYSEFRQQTSLRAKILTLLHLFIGYCIILF